MSLLFKDYVRFLNACCFTTALCCDCPLSPLRNGKDVECEALLEKYPEEFEAIVEKWAKGNPVNTMETEFLKLHSKASAVFICPKQIDNTFVCSYNQVEFGSCGKCKYEYWNKKIYLRDLSERVDDTIE